MNKTTPFEKRKPDHKLKLMSDSQGRDVILHIDNLLSTNFNHFGHVLPGAKMKSINTAGQNNKKISTYTKSDYIVWIGSTNYISNYPSINCQNMQDVSKTLLSKTEEAAVQYAHTNLILSTIPYRYDLQEANEENKKI